jgi:magnesium chelatase family protein
MDVPRVDYEKLASNRTGEASEAVRQRVFCARERQLARFGGSGLSCNADEGAHLVRHPAAEARTPGRSG